MRDRNPAKTAVTFTAASDALVYARMKLNPAPLKKMITGASPCADLWDDQLELIELLMEIDAALGLGRELDWQKAPPRSASVKDLIDWIVKEMNHG